MLTIIKKKIFKNVTSLNKFEYRLEIYEDRLGHRVTEFPLYETSIVDNIYLIIKLIE
jgi:hypothetical protein